MLTSLNQILTLRSSKGISVFVKKVPKISNHMSLGCFVFFTFLPLEAFLLLSLLADLGELPFIVLPCSALLGFASGVVLHSLHLLLPCFHQLVITLADLLLLCTQHETCTTTSRGG